MMDAGVRVRTIVARGGVVIADIPYTLALTLSEYFSRLVDADISLFCVNYSNLRKIFTVKEVTIKPSLLNNTTKFIDDQFLS